MYDRNRPNGLAIIISLIIVSVFLIHTGGYFYDRTYPQIIAATFMFLSFLGLTVEINKIFSNRKYEGIKNIVSGMTIALLTGLILKLGRNDVGRLFLVCLLTMAIYVVIVEFVKLFSNFSINNLMKDNPIKNIFLILSQIFAMALTVAQLLQILNFIK
jgi:hypothetical protein